MTKSKKTEKKWKVFLSRDLHGRENLPELSAVIYPSNQSWNDFGHKTHATLFVHQSGDVRREFPIYVGVLGSDKASFASYLADEAGFSAEQERVEITAQTPLFTMMPASDNYRDLVQLVGPSVSRTILTAARDLVNAQRTKPLPQWARVARNMESFELAFMRNTETFFAYHNAVTILEGLGSESLTSISSNLELAFKLDGFSNPHHFKFSFDPQSILPKRIAVIIGKNGIGKSQALNRIVRYAISGKNDELLNDPNPECFRDMEYGRPRISRIVAITTPGETQYTFPPTTKKSSYIAYHRLTLGRGKQKGARGIGGLLVQLARHPGTIGSSRRWDVFLRAVERALPLNDIKIPTVTRNDDGIFRGFVTIPGLMSAVGEQRSLELWHSVNESADPARVTSSGVQSLSSGQMSFLRFALLACLHIENGTLVLIDEPETHLHPNLISVFVELLDTMLELTGSAAIVATHSAYLVREVPRSQVHVVQDADGVISVNTPRLKTFGADVGSISTFVFDDDITARLMDRIREKLPQGARQRREMLSVMEGELSDEAIMEFQVRPDR
ncbi:MAG: hypothetical protein JWR07_2596 [Nevskia sp.]|nr:hypothetical protein [Nevskia sp.]